MNTSIINDVIKAMPDHIAIKVRRVAKDRKTSIAEAIIFLVQKALMPLTAELF